MQHNNKYSFKNLGVIAMLFGITFYASADMMQADMANFMAARIEDSIGTSTTTTFGNMSLNILAVFRPKTLCEEGTYLEKCGNQTIGFNWLKSIDINDTPTRNYYDAAATISKKYEKMREVFSSTGNVGATFKDSSNQTTQASHAEVVDDRNRILNYFCSDLDDVHCAPCPNNGKVDASIAYTNTNSTDVTSTVNVFSWNIRTFADCYMDEFEDSTGTYVYQNGTSEDAERCYYGQSGFPRIFLGTDVVEAVQVMDVSYSNEAVAH
ncbi:MAG: hypothetical protein IJQ55_02565 [Alphaproteobacteria bacterium]|nr:hypothetical protein [Alphaproteobacteria bacterium]